MLRNRNCLIEYLGIAQYQSALDLIEDRSATDTSDDDRDSDDQNSDDHSNGDDDGPLPKKTRTHFPRKPMKSSNWWTMFLSPESRQEYATNPGGRLAQQFRRMFRVPYGLFVEKILNLAIQNWWPDWSEDKVDACGRPVSNLELQLLGALFTLGTSATFFVVSLNTNISEEVHRKFFAVWVFNMNSIHHEYIYMPRTEREYQFVVGEYTAMGFPGCIGSVDCVHIGWDQCPYQYTNMYDKGKEGFTSIAYEVICTSRKFIQSVTRGHPGARNDKHIVRTDDVVMSLLAGNGWLNSKAWEVTTSPNGALKVFDGVYLICDGGYHRWPCLMFPVKAGQPESPLMRFSKTLESVRKDIEGVFGILKRRFKFLKAFNQLHKQSTIDDAFVTCCMIHNMLLREDGWLDSSLPHFRKGLKSHLNKRFLDPRGDALWNRGYDTTPDDEEMINEDAAFCRRQARRSSQHTPTELAKRWQKVLEALVAHHACHDYGTHDE